METFNTIIEKATMHDSEALNTLITLMTPYLVKSFLLENQGFFDISSINISEKRAIGMDISLYLVRK